MSRRSDEILAGLLLDEDVRLSLAELCECADVQAETITEMVAYGIVEPLDDTAAQWRFTGTSLKRVTTVVRLQRDLGVNLAGAALALDLLDEIQSLRRRR